MAAFGPIAPFYDELMHKVPYDMWVAYYELLLMQQEANPTSLLDVCCGTGNVAEIMTMRGYQVSGIDISRAMIEEAQRKAAENRLEISYLAADAAKFDLGYQVDAAYSFFDSFNYITDLGHLGRAMRCVAAHLPPGGSLVFDVNTAYAFEAKMFDQKDTRKKARVQYDWHGDYDPSTRVIRVEMDFWVDGKPFHEVHVQRAHSHDELVDLLIVSGFEEIHAFDSYTLDPPRKRSDRVHYSAKRARS